MIPFIIFGATSLLFITVCIICIRDILDLKNDLNIS
jgi:hypothetical protein